MFFRFQAVVANRMCSLLFIGKFIEKLLKYMLTASNLSLLLRLEFGSAFFIVNSRAAHTLIQDK